MAGSRKTEEPGRFAYEGLDRIMHEKARLGILTSLLARPEGILFNELKELCSLTDGNLSRHIQALQEAELVEVILIGSPSLAADAPFSVEVAKEMLLRLLDRDHHLRQNSRAHLAMPALFRYPGIP